MQIPYTVEARPDTGLTNGRLGMWLFLASEVMLFGALFSSYFILRTGALSWPDGELNLFGASVNTVLLLTSSVTLSKAYGAVSAGKQDAFRRLLAITMVLAALFLGIKSMEYNEHLSRGEYPSRSTFFAVYYTLTGFHALHIAGGLVAMLQLLLFGGRLSSAGQLVNRVEYVGLYWHFVDVIWVMLFVMLYVV